MAAVAGERRPERSAIVRLPLEREVHVVENAARHAEEIVDIGYRAPRAPWIGRLENPHLVGSRVFDFRMRDREQVAVESGNVGDGGVASTGKVDEDGLGTGPAEFPGRREGTAAEVLVAGAGLHLVHRNTNQADLRFPRLERIDVAARRALIGSAELHERIEQERQWRWRLGPGAAPVDGFPDRVAGTSILRVDARVHRIVGGDDRHHLALAVRAGAAMDAGHVDAGLVAGDGGDAIGGLLRADDHAIAPGGQQGSVRGPGHRPDVAALLGRLVEIEMPLDVGDSIARRVG